MLPFKIDSETIDSTGEAIVKILNSRVGLALIILAFVQFNGLDKIPTKLDTLISNTATMQTQIAACIKKTEIRPE